MYAVTIMRFARQPAPAPGTSCPEWYFLGAGLAQWTVWQASTVVGIALGAQIPPGWALDFAVALTFIALVVPALTDRPSVAAAVAAGIVAVLTGAWPYRLGLVVAALIGIAVGLLVEGRPTARTHRP